MAYVDQQKAFKIAAIQGNYIILQDNYTQVI